MNTTREEALKALDDIFNFCEEIDNSLPENERSGYKMLPDIHKIRKYIIENTRPHGKWIRRHIINGTDWAKSFDMYVCSNCGEEFSYDAETGVSMNNYNTCPNCGADMRKREEVNL